MEEKEEKVVVFNAESTNPKDFTKPEKSSWFNGSLIWTPRAISTTYLALNKNNQHSSVCYTPDTLLIED